MLLHAVPCSSSDSISQWLEPGIRQLLVSSIIGMHTISSHSLRIEARPCVHYRNRAIRCSLPSSPRSDSGVERDNTLAALSAVRRVHGDDLGHEYLHGGLRCAHLIDELAECCCDLLWRAIVPDVVGSEVHHDDVRFRRGEPTRELILVRDVHGEEAALDDSISMPVSCCHSTDDRTCPSFSPSY